MRPVWPFWRHTQKHRADPPATGPTVNGNVSDGNRGRQKVSRRLVRAMRQGPPWVFPTARGNEERQERRCTWTASRGCPQVNSVSHSLPLWLITHTSPPHHFKRQCMLRHYTVCLSRKRVINKHLLIPGGSSLCCLCIIAGRPSTKYDFHLVKIIQYNVYHP